MHLFPPHPQRVRHAIDVVEPGSDQRDLQNSLIIKSRGSQPFDIIFPNLGRVLGELDHIIEHHAILGRDWRRSVVLLQRLHQVLIQRHPTQKLCV